MRCPLGLALGLALGVAPATAALAAGPRVAEQDVVVLTLRPMTAHAVDRAAGESHELTVRPGSPATLELELAWPEPSGRTTVRFTASLDEAEPGQLAVELAAEATLPQAGTTQATRRLVAGDGTTTILELGRRRRAALVFAVQAALGHEPHVVIEAATPGRPCLLLLEIQRVRGHDAITVETNQLATFVGEPVSYGFKLGETGVGDALEIRLEPRRLTGDIAEIDIQVTGTLPSGDGLLAISRAEQWHTSRGAASTLSIEVGDPPVGYRFRVTPYF